MKSFMTKHQDKITGTIETFDRMIFKGHILPLFSKSGRNFFLSQNNILLKSFGTFAQGLSDKIKVHAQQLAAQNRRPHLHLRSKQESQEDVVERIMKNNPVKEGLVCVLTTLEPCLSFDIQFDKSVKKLGLILRERRCLVIYFYYQDPHFGLIHIRLQTWFPFSIQIYINGRQWLAKELDKKGVKYQMYDNAFQNIDNLKLAQSIASRLETFKFAKTLDALAKRVNPLLPQIKQAVTHGYYWVLAQAEYATDVMFKNRQALMDIYPEIIDHAFLNFQAKNVMTFLGRQLCHRFKGELVCSKIHRPQGFRIKHRMKKNSIKMYDKFSVLRIETTINNPREFKIFRLVKRKGKLIKCWSPMGKSVFNIFAYAKVSKLANHRYLNALAAFDTVGHCIKDIEQFAQPVISNSNRVAGFNPLLPSSSKAFTAVLDGAYAINGFRNFDLKKLIFDQPCSNDKEYKKRSGQVTRLIRKLRAHQLVAKIPRSHRYRVSSKGYRILGACLTLKNQTLPQQICSYKWQ
jgi:hypothetical protein